MRACLLSLSEQIGSHSVLDRDASHPIKSNAASRAKAECHRLMFAPCPPARRAERRERYVDKRLSCGFASLLTRAL